MKESEFLTKIYSRNRKWSKLRQKEKQLETYRKYPGLTETCMQLEQDIELIKNELKISWISVFYDDVGLKNHLKSNSEYEIMDVKLLNKF